ncbi:MULTISPECIES: DUF11 domain-containing protein [unclassified Sphingomonas]|jgi:uncharacterized repeat protein (TIGR01451 family)|uniref:DUF11 domain-containing protein n=1 Tax=unclassified Sphingomonas TaxID=196159 RepID=UPI000701A6D7|nr:MULTISPECIES: DUF11 domain-containing protein [unclassified Sphingomonas]KQN28734.1 hypothetical protein ASE88_06800 [Sphingomonas sp. Leaf38]KQN32086.1 hypothetical protein ASF00_04930 [Sphingomonas sp. Leaf34]
MYAKGVIRTLMAGTAAVVSLGIATNTASAQAPGPAGTAAGTAVTNTAQASYSVNGVQQSATSNTTSFVVDRKVNLTVTTNQPANTQVAIGQTAAVTTFKVTNNTNGTQDFLLSASQLPIQNLFAGDNFEVTNVKIYVDSNGNGTYDAGADTATYINELPADQSAVVFIVADIPNDQAASLAGITLITQVAAGGDGAAQGAPLAASVALNDDNVVDIVFADNDSDGLGLDFANNGQGRASLGYEITTRNVALSVNKSQIVISDPVSGLVTPKAIPGAVVQYCLIVTNATALTPANNVNLTDIIPANTTYQAGSIVIGVPGIAPICTVAGFIANDNGTAILGTNFTGSYDPSTKKVTATIPTLLGSTSVAASFRVTIN